MPTLAQSLHGHDLGHLQIIAEHWGLELTSIDSGPALTELSTVVLNVELIAEIVAAFSLAGQAALDMLLQNEGRLPWSQFTRSFGDVRPMGPGRRDRERPDREPISPTEELWYRAIIARAFFDTPSGAQEFAYIPDDLLPLILVMQEVEKTVDITKGHPLLGRAATPEERAYPFLVDDRLLDHVCTLLASHRLQIDPTDQFPASSASLLEFANTILKTANLLASNGLPDIENVRSHLEANRAAALFQLTQSWLQSREHNDLRHVPHLQPEGEWSNDPFVTRGFVIGLLKAIPVDAWWSFSAFLADLRRDYPDFQRPASNYDSWFIRDTRTNEFLRGFEHWDDVDGALVRYLITGPLYWLGIIDLAGRTEKWAPQEATAFRISKWARLLFERDSDLLESKVLKGFRLEDAPIHVRSDGRVNIPFLSPRAARYQIARFCQWELPTSHEYRYRFTPGSLEQAIEQGLKIQHLQTLLARYTQNVPPNIVKALGRWDQRGIEARLQSALVLRLGSPELLKAIRDSRASRYLGEPLGPTTVIVKPGAGEKVLEVLTEMGYLGELIKHS